MREHQSRPRLDHHLACGHLLCITCLTEVFVAEVEQTFLRELLHAVAERHVFLDVDRQVHERLLSHALVLATLALRDGD